MNARSRLRRTPADRVRWLLVASAGLLLVGIAWAVGDWYVQRRALSRVGLPTPDTRVTVSYENRVLERNLAVRWRYRYGVDGLIPFDRPVGLAASGKVDADYADRLIAFMDEYGHPRRIQISIDEGDVSDPVLRRIGTLEDLTELSVARDQAAAGQSACTDAGCAALFRVPKLRSVELYGLPVGDAAAASLAANSSPHLHDVSIGRSQVTDTGLAEFVTLSSLRRLKLHDSRTTREGAWAFRLARPEVMFGGPNVPERVTGEEFLAYRKRHERLRQAWGGPGPTTPPHALGR